MGHLTYARLLLMLSLKFTSSVFFLIPIPSLIFSNLYCFSSLDHEQLPDLMEVLEALLKDRSTMVLGSALWAFNEICPDRFDLLHVHFRKLCRLLADNDEWGQIVILNTLTRYSRTQFTNPEGQVPLFS